MEDNDKNLERFFKKFFDQNPKPEPWNTPEDDIWANIESAIAPQKEEKKRNWLIIPFFLTAVGLSLTGYFYAQVHSLQHQIQELNNALKTCQASAQDRDAQNQNAQIQPITQGDETLPTTPTIQPQPALKNRGENGRNSIYFPNSKQKSGHQKLPAIDQKTTANEPTITAKVAESTLEEPILAATGKEPTPNEPILAATGKEPTPNEPNSWPSEAPQRFFDEQPKDTTPTAIPKDIRDVQQTAPTQPSPHQNNPAPQTESVHEKKQRAYPLQIGLNTQFIAWNDRYAGQLNVPLSELLTNEKTANTVLVGIAARKGIAAHWSLDAGLGYTSRQQVSNYSLNIPYSTATEQANPSGGYDNTFRHSLPSGLGTVNTELTLSRAQNSSVTDQENVNLDFAFTNTKQLLHVPLQLTYYPISMKKGLLFSLGLNTELTLLSRVGIVKAKSNHTTIHEKSAAVTFPDNQASKINLSATFDAGYQLALSKYLTGTVQVGYQYALTNQYKNNGYTHKIDAFGVKLGVLRAF